MPRSVPGLDAPFSIDDGVRAGLARDELEDPRWIRPFSGVRSFAEPETPQELAEAYAVKMRPEAYFSHVTAGVLQGMWLPAPLQTLMLLDVAVPPGVRAPRDRRVRGHHLIQRPGLVRARDGVRVASPRETWCQLVTILGLEDLIVAGEGLLAKNRAGRLRIDELVAAVAAGGRPRRAMLERALPELRQDVRSAKETALRRLLVAHGLPEPEINGDVLDADGRRIGECDLVYRAYRVVVEYEGAQHFERVQGRKDVREYERLAANGWTVVRVVQDDLADPALVVFRVRAAMAATAA